MSKNDQDPMLDYQKTQEIVHRYLSDFDKRDMDWLIFHLTGKDPDQIKSMEKDKIVFQKIRHLSAKHGVTVERMVKIRRLNVENVIKDLSWIDEKNRRLQIFVLNKLDQERHTRNVRLHSMPWMLSFKNMYRSTIKHIDFLSFGDETGFGKCDAILRIKSDWEKNRTPSKKVDWVDVNDRFQLEWIYDYLTENAMLARGPVPEKNEEFFEIILASFDLVPAIVIKESTDSNGAESSDQADTPHDGSKSVLSQLTEILGETVTLKEKNIFIELTRRAWNQKKFRDRKRLAELERPLGKMAKTQLKRLAVKKKLGETDVLEQLIQEAYDNANLTSK